MKIIILIVLLVSCGSNVEVTPHSQKSFEIGETLSCVRFEGKLGFGFNYTVQRISDASVYVMCSVVYDNIQFSNSYIYMDWQEGSDNGSCTIYTNPFGDKYGYFSFIVKEDAVVEYHGNNKEKDGYSFIFSEKDCESYIYNAEPDNTKK